MVHQRMVSPRADSPACPQSARASVERRSFGCQHSAASGATMTYRDSQSPALRSRVVSEPRDLRCLKPRCIHGWSAKRPACVSVIQDAALRYEDEGQASAQPAPREPRPDVNHERSVPLKFAEELVDRLTERLQANEMKLQDIREELHLRDGANASLKQELQELEQSLRRSRSREDWLAKELQLKTEVIIELRESVQALHLRLDSSDHLNANLKLELEECQRNLQHSKHKEDFLMQELRSKVTELRESRELRDIFQMPERCVQSRNQKLEENELNLQHCSIGGDNSTQLLSSTAHPAVEFCDNVQELRERFLLQSRELFDLQARLAVKEQELGQHLCLLCFEAPRDLLIQPCGHLIYCRKCCTRAGLECPVCRGRISSYQRVFM
eukprot:TRINITY_DN2593_c0_g2_i1.p1 TRINITY_DN2593_c0_g2~~TRINITY_DN2593_c0_g2_i1.p1  ORF type:complete len:384 (+),score=42.43 TRINITY_DN2593_c0_g2_i1:49-1200(+)